MVKKTTIDPKELLLFEQAMRNVKRLTAKRKAPLRPAEKKIIKPKVSQLEKENKAELLNYTNHAPTVSSEQFISYHQASISYKVLRKLRKGQYNVEASLDLHGMTIETAEKQVNYFLHHCLDNNIKVALIIHGKSRQNFPVLKNQLNKWLRGVPSILAFCSASPANGSRGAIYILLKSRSEENCFEKFF